MDSSDSDDLEDAPDFIKMKVPEKKSTVQENPQETVRKEQKKNKLDSLLLEHKQQEKEEEYLLQTKTELLNAVKQNKQESDSAYKSEFLTDKTLKFIEQVNTSICEQGLQRGQQILFVEELGCLFTESLTLADCGFKPSSTPLDRLLASVSPVTLSSILLSSLFTSNISHSPQADVIKNWLFYLMSIHSSQEVSSSCFKSLITLNQQNKRKILNGKKCCPAWCPSANDLLKVFVNWGADPDVLLGQQSVHSQMSYHFDSLVKPDNSSSKESKLTPKLCQTNISYVLKVLSACSQLRPSLRKEDLKLMIYMLAKTSLDPVLQRLPSEYQVCLSSVLECFAECEWSEMIPELCEMISGIGHSHLDDVLLAELFTLAGRSEQLQIPLSYTLMQRLLLPEAKTLSNQQLLDLQVVDIAWLGKSPDWSSQSELATQLSQMVTVDTLKMDSVLQLLDICVGDEHHRTTKLKDQLEYLVEQLKLVIKGIRDSMYKEHQSKIKDALSRLKVKWSLSLLNRKSVQRSIFSWATHNKSAVKENVLRDFVRPQTSDWEDEFTS